MRKYWEGMKRSKSDRSKIQVSTVNPSFETNRSCNNHFRREAAGVRCGRRAPSRDSKCVAELTCARLAEYRSDQVVALFIDLASRHRVLRATAHRFGVMLRFAPVTQGNFDDSLPARHRRRQCVVAAQIDAAA